MKKIYMNKIIFFVLPLLFTFAINDEISFTLEMSPSLYKNDTLYLSSILFLRLGADFLLGTPPQKVFLCFDWTSALSFITSKHYIVNSSTSAKSTKDSNMNFYEEKIMSGYSNEDIISLPNNNFTQFYFKHVIAYFVRDMDRCDGYIGMKFDEVTKRYETFLSQLCSNNFINKQLFTIEYISSLKRKITFDPIINKDDIVFECKIKEDKLLPIWHASVHNVLLNQNKILRSPLSSIRFDSSFGLVLADPKYKKPITNELGLNSKCVSSVFFLNESTNNFDFYYVDKKFEYFLCPNSFDIENDQILSFYFVDVKSKGILNINLNTFWSYYNNTHKLFNIVFHLERENSFRLYDFIIGDAVMKNYKVIFDRDEYKIQFIKHITLNNKALTLININIAIIICNCIILLYVYLTKLHT